MVDQRPSLYSIHLSTARSWRGGENQIWLLARGLKARGHKVLVLAPRGAPLLDRCYESGVPTRTFNLFHQFDPLAVLRLIGILKREKPDVLHLHDGHSVLPGQLAARTISKSTLKVVAHRRTVFKVRGRWKYRGRVDKIVAISEAVRHCLLDAGVPDDGIRVAYSGLEFPERLAADSVEARSLRSREKIPPQALLIGHAAALTSEKRQLDLLEALHQVNETLKVRGLEGVHLALAGDGVEEEQLRGAVHRLGLEAQVHFLGFVRDLRPLWAATSLAMYVSEAEGLCTGLVEAQGAGLPAVVTKAGGMVEVVADGKTGIHVGIGNISEMAAAILRIHDDEGLRKEMSHAAAAHARLKFSADAMVDGILEAYR